LLCGDWKLKDHTLSAVPNSVFSIGLFAYTQWRPPNPQPEDGR